jgi:hypothetical protein
MSLAPSLPMMPFIKNRNSMVVFSLALLLPLLASSCGGSSDSTGSTTPAAAPTAGPVPNPAATPINGPNLQVDQADAASSILFDSQAFEQTDCEVVEGCVAGTGTRQLLKFNADIINAGNEDFYLGDPATNPMFKYSPCHNHYHLQNIMLYELVDASGQVVTARSGSMVHESGNQRGLGGCL